MRLSTFSTTLILLLSFLSQNAFAGWSRFSPFEFLDDQIRQRLDLRGQQEALQLELREILSPSVSSVQFNDVRVSLFSEVFAILEAIAASPGSSVPSIDRSAGCAAHRSVDAAQLNGMIAAIKSSSSCSSLTSKSVKALSDARQICESVVYPETYVQSQDPRDVSLSTVSSLSNQIRLAGSALKEFDLPAPLRSPALLDRIRTILSKVRYSELMSIAGSRISAYDDLISALKKNRSCMSDSDPTFAARIDSLNALKNELTQVRAYLMALDQSGRLQAERDRQALWAQGRFRDPLPYPSLSDQERQFISLYLGGIYWRMRGGGLLDEPKGTQLTRIYFTLMSMSVIGDLNGGEIGAQIGQNIYYPLFQPWGRFMDMGREPNQDDSYSDLMNMTKRGQTQVGMAVSALKANGYLTTDLAIGGLQMGPCYYYSFEKLAGIMVNPDAKPPYSSFVDNPTAWGELCSGAVIALGLSKNLLKGVDQYTWSRKMNDLSR